MRIWLLPHTAMGRIYCIGDSSIFHLHFNVWRFANHLRREKRLTLSMPLAKRKSLTATAAALWGMPPPWDVADCMYASNFSTTWISIWIFWSLPGHDELMLSIRTSNISIDSCLKLKAATEYRSEIMTMIAERERLSTVGRAFFVSMLSIKARSISRCRPMPFCISWRD